MPSGANLGNIGSPKPTQRLVTYNDNCRLVNPAPPGEPNLGIVPSRHCAQYLITIKPGIRMSSRIKRRTTFSDRYSSDNREKEFDKRPKMGKLIPHRRPARILVVDDNPDITAVMQELLSSVGYEVITVADATAAEAEIKRQLPDLILSDVIMPGKSGYEFCRQIKDDPATRLIPLILITGLGDRGDSCRESKLAPTI